MRTRRVHDEVAVKGKVIEKTDDYYAQDKSGNVWYMGEDAKDLKGSQFVVAPDSWRAGVNGAKPGIIQEANPKVGDSYQEENAPGVAEDQAKVLSLNATVNDVPYCNTAPSGTCDNLLETKETSPLDPQSENKWYAKGVGEVKEAVVGVQRFAASAPSALGRAAPAQFANAISGVTAVAGAHTGAHRLAER